ncbi:hypothetical protein SAMN02745172_03674 [Pseudoxanthobacter soli DSM 19599]|uniref:Uncharacterized protein n=2 Tax=Pseudoxanthobacter TaxID=433838 RepID=A0A1M7ZQB7_9HYPH|nr:hypothetical protein SAMN02745172_03674 [Pseudoxanthobacter soli DSM 19599]
MITSDMIFKLAIVAAVVGAVVWLREPPARPKAQIGLSGPVVDILKEHRATTGSTPAGSSIPE